MIGRKGVSTLLCGIIMMTMVKILLKNEAMTTSTTPESFMTLARKAIQDRLRGKGHRVQLEVSNKSINAPGNGRTAIETLPEPVQGQSLSMLVEGEWLPNAKEHRWHWKAGKRPQEPIGGIPLDRYNCTLGGEYCPGGELADYERGKDLIEAPFPPDADIRQGRSADDGQKFQDSVRMLHVSLAPGLWKLAGRPTPKVIHTVWISANLRGHNEVPDYVKNNLRKWRAVEPEYRTVVWQNEDIEFHFPHIVPLLKQIPMPAWIADIVRYGIIYRFGGIFLDSDTAPVRPFDEFVQRISPFAVCTGATGYSDNGTIYTLTAEESMQCRRYANGMFGSPPWSIHLGSVFQEAIWRTIHLGKNGTKKFDFGFTGPFLFTTYLRGKPFTFLPMHTFMPCTWRNIKDCIVEKYVNNNCVCLFKSIINNCFEVGRGILHLQSTFNSSVWYAYMVELLGRQRRPEVEDEDL